MSIFGYCGYWWQLANCKQITLDRDRRRGRARARSGGRASGGGRARRSRTDLGRPRQTVLSHVAAILPPSSGTDALPGPTVGGGKQEAAAIASRGGRSEPSQSCSQPQHPTLLSNRHTCQHLLCPDRGNKCSIVNTFQAISMGDLIIAVDSLHDKLNGSTQYTVHNTRTTFSLLHMHF